MWFLIIQILLLLLLAAVFGAWLMYWWMSNRYEDVTSIHEELLDKSSLGVVGLTRKDLDSAMASSIRSLKLPDLEPVTARLSAVERAVAGFSAPKLDIAPFQQRFDSIERRLSNTANQAQPAQEVKDLTARLANIEASVKDVSTGLGTLAPRNVDLTPIAQRLEGIEAQFRAPNQDIAALHQRLGGIEQSLVNQAKPSADAVPPAGLNELYARIDGVERAVREIPQVDLGPLHSGLALLELAIEGIEFPMPNFEPIHGQIGEVEAKIAQLSERMDNGRRTDSQNIMNRMATLDQRLTNLPSAEGPGIDLDPVIGRMSSLEMRISSLADSVGMPAPQQINLDPMFGRLDDISQKLVMMGDRLEGGRRSEIDLLASRINNLSNSLAEVRPIGDAQLGDRLDNIERAVKGIVIPQVNLRPLQVQMTDIERAISTLTLPETDLQPLQVQLSELERSVRNLKMPETDMNPILTMLAGLESAVTTHSGTDVAPLMDRMSDIERAVSDIVVPEPDLRPITVMLTGLERAIADTRGESADLSPVVTRLVEVEDAMRDLHRNMRNIQPVSMDAVERQLGSLQDSIYELRSRDYSSLMSDSRADLEAMENRLTSIEYGLAAVHHMLRSRNDGSSDDRDTLSANWRTSESRIDENSILRESRGSKNDLDGQRPYPPRDTNNFIGSSRSSKRVNLLEQPIYGTADDLERISGVGPMLNALLQELGVFYYWQIADWSENDIDWVDSQLAHFKGRIRSENWVPQAQKMVDRGEGRQRPS